MKSSAISFSLALLSLVACSGKVSSTSGSDGGPGSVNDSTNDNPPTGPQGALVPACPSSKPTLGVSCSPIGQLCEYGDDVSSQCNYVAHCSPNAVWESVSGDGCTTSLPSCAANVADETTCNFGDGQCTTASGLCTCFDHSTGPGMQSDGGTIPDTYAYSCASPDSRCPVWPKRPRIGSACGAPDLLCDYAPCGPYGFAFRCDGAGFWDDAFGAQCGGG